MKTLLTGLMTVALAATPIVTINQTTTQQEKNSNISISLSNYKDTKLSSTAHVSFGWINSTDSHSSGTSNIICIDDYATSIEDFIAQFSKIQISDGGSDMTQNYIGYTNPVYPTPHRQGNFVKDAKVLKTADLFKINQSIETQIGSYDYSDFSTAAHSYSTITTAITETAGKTFLTMYCTSSVSGHAGPFGSWQYVQSQTDISKVDFLA